MTQEPDAVTLLAEIDETRARIRDLLRSVDPEALANRPKSGDWCAIENVRHLIFAEQLHLGRFVPGGRPWNAAGLTPHFLADEAAFRDVGTNPTTDLDELFEIWDTVHAPMREVVVMASEGLAEALRRNLKHLSGHLRIIERLLGKR